MEFDKRQKMMLVLALVATISAPAPGDAVLVIQGRGRRKDNPPPDMPAKEKPVLKSKNKTARDFRHSAIAQRQAQYRIKDYRNRLSPSSRKR